MREAGYTDREILEKAVREVVENETEEIYRYGMGKDLEDLTPYLRQLGEDILSVEAREAGEDLVVFLADFYEEGMRGFEKHLREHHGG